MSSREILTNLANFGKELANSLAIFKQKIELRGRARLFGVVLAWFFFPQFSIVDSKTVQRSLFCRSRRELSNVYLLAKFGFDTAPVPSVFEDSPVYRRRRR